MIPIITTPRITIAIIFHAKKKSVCNPELAGNQSNCDRLASYSNICTINGTNPIISMIGISNAFVFFLFA